MQYRRISADCHLDLPWLPADLFTTQAKRELKDRMPFVEDGPDGPKWTTTKAGVFTGIPGAVGLVGAPFVPGQNYRVDKMAETMASTTPAEARRAAAPGDPASAHQGNGEATASTPRSSSVSSGSRHGSRGPHRGQRDAAHLQRLACKDFCSHSPRPPDRLRVPGSMAISRRRRRRSIASPSSASRAPNCRLVGHGSDVAPVLGALVEGGQRRAAAAAFPHLPRRCRSGCATSCRRA